MDTRTEERVNGWDSRSFSDGYEGLRGLSDRDFSGAVQAGRAWLFMLNGRIVGLFDGTIGDFEDAEGTVYTAPDPSLPLLFAMRETGGETQAKYYTEDTPVSEADGTLSSGSFTGYIELSENVLSGDYYVVYYGGRSMACAFVGNSEKLLTGDEAFERADGEVGIYEVRNVDIEVTEIPEPEEPEPDDTGAAGAGGAGVGATGSGLGGGDAGSGLAGGEDTADAAAEDDAPSDATADPLAGGVGSGTGGVDRTDADEGTVPDDDPVTAASDLDETGADDLSTADAGTGGPESDETTGSTTDGERGPSDSASTDAGTTDYAVVDTDAEDGYGVADEEPAEATDAGESAQDVGTVEEPGATEPRTERDAGRTGSGDAERSEPPTSESAGRTGAGAADPGAAEPGEATESPATGAGPDAATTADDVDLDEVAEELDLMMDEPDGPEREPEPTEGIALGGTDADDDGGASPPGADPDYEREKEWRETRTIPSLNPDKTDESGTTTASASATGGGRSRGESRGGGRSRGTGDGPDRTGGTSGSGRDDDRTGQERTTEAAGSRDGRARDRDEGGGAASGGRRDRSGAGSQRSGADAKGGRDAGGGDDDALGQDMLEREDTIDRLKLKLQELEGERDDLLEEREALRERLQSVQAEREALAEENDELSGEVERLEATVRELRSEVQELEDTLEDVQGAAATMSRELSRQEALEGTNLFVRYESKGDATLEDAHAGNAAPEDVSENLRLEYHTQFDTDDVSVEGLLFDEFLYSTMEYQFVDWAITKLLFEVRDSGNAGAVAPLYDAVPQIDRAELRGEVALANADGVTEGTHVFDVVLRDRMGNPLFVVELNDSRDPATQEMMVSLNEHATGTKYAAEQLAGAFMVTASFFQPDALETASEATSGSLLSRDSRRSFVKLSRKRGYHLCLVEAREGEFHINVPEL